MKPIKKIASAALLLCLPLGIVYAESKEAPAEAPEKPMTMPKGMGMRHGMGPMGRMGQMSDEERDKHLRMYQEHQLKMHDLSNRILAERDEKKKEQLKNEQLELMKAHQAQMMSQRMERMQMRQKPNTPPPAAKPAK